MTTRPVRTAVKRPGAGVTLAMDELGRAHRLIRMREIRLLSRAQLAARMSAGDDEFSITPDAIAKIENGYRRPKIVTLNRLCEALGCDAGDLLPDRKPSAPASSRRPACPKCGGIYAHDSGCPDAT